MGRKTAATVLSWIAFGAIAGGLIYTFLGFFQTANMIDTVVTIQFLFSYLIGFFILIGRAGMSQIFTGLLIIGGGLVLQLIASIITSTIEGGL